MKALVIVALLLAGCGSDVCEQRSGHYLVTHHERSGTCGAIGDDLIYATPGQDPLAEGCAGVVDETEDRCNVYIDTTCTASNGAVIEMYGAMDWGEDGSEGSGVIEYAVSSDGYPICRSVYDVTFSRQ